GIPRERPDLLGGQLLQAFEVDNNLRGWFGAGRHPAFWQELDDRHTVKVRQLRQLLHGDGAVAALVGTDDDGLPAACRLLLHPVQRQALLLADAAELGPERLRVITHLVLLRSFTPSDQ